MGADTASLQIDCTKSLCCFGDYFSRLLAEQFYKLGFPMPVTVLGRIAELSKSTCDALDRATAAGIAQEIEWAGRIFEEQRTPDRKDCLKFALSAERRFVDVGSPRPVLMGENDFLAQREAIWRVVSEAFHADYLLLVLSDSQTFRDVSSGVCVSAGVAAMHGAGRFAEEYLDAAQNAADVRRIAGIVRKFNAHCKIILAVSPLSVQAGERTKTMLQEACRELCRTESYCTYLPLYEDACSVSSAVPHALAGSLFEKNVLPHCLCSPGTAAFWKSYAAEMAGDSLKALEYGEKAAACEPHNVRYVASYADCLVHEGRLAEAAEALKKAKAAGASSQKLNQSIVFLCLQSKDAGSQLLPDEQTLERDTSRIESFICYSKLLSLQQRHEEAEAVLRKAGAEYPWAPDGFIDLSVLLRNQGRLNEALAASQEALRVCPSTARTHFILAEILGACGQNIEAEFHYRAGLEIDPFSSGVRRRFCNWLIGRERNDEALTLAEEGMRLCPNAAESVLNYAACLEIGGRMAEAETQLKKGIVQHPAVRSLYGKLIGLLSKDPAKKAELDYYKRKAAELPV